MKTDWGQSGNNGHLTRVETGRIDPKLIAHIPGAAGERRGEHRNRSGADWEHFKKDLAENGIKFPITIFSESGKNPVVYEGNHRIDAALELGMGLVPVDIRYFGKAEDDGLVYEKQDILKVALKNGRDVPPEVLVELAPDTGEKQGYPVGSKTWFKGDEVTITTKPYQEHGEWWQNATTEAGKKVSIATPEHSERSVKAKQKANKDRQDQFGRLHKPARQAFDIGQKVRFHLATGGEGVGSYRGPDTDGGVVLAVDGQMWHVAQEDVIGPFDNKNSDEDQKFQQFRQAHEKLSNGKYTALKDMRFELRKQGWTDAEFDAYAMDMAAEGVVVLLTEFDGRDPDLRKHGVVDPVFPDDVYTFLKWREEKDSVTESIFEGIPGTPPPGGSMAAFKKFQAVQEKIEKRSRFIDDWLKSHRRVPFKAKTNDGRDVVLTKSTKPGYVWQMTFFDRNGEPISDINYRTYEAAMKDHSNGIDTLSIEPIKRRKSSQILEDAAPVSRTGIFDEILTANSFGQIENAVKRMLEVSALSPSPEPVTAESIIALLKQASREEIEKIGSYLADIDNQVAKEVNYRSRTGKSVRVVEGRMDVAYLPDNSELGFQYAVVEIDDLVTSHTDSFHINEDFPQEAQPRDRERAAARLQVEEMAKKLNPSRLGESQSVTAGAPIAGRDMVVESGNGRSIAIRKAYRNFPEKADEYRAWVLKNAEKLGLSGAKIGGMKEPVLIRVRKSELDRADFARKANQAEIAQMSPTEIARADAERITDDDLAVFAPSEDGRVLARSNTTFIDRFLSKLGTNETAGLLTKDGRYTKQLEDRIKAAVFEKAYGDPVLLEFMAEETDPKIKNIITALTISAPGWVSAKAVDPELGGINIPSHAIGAAKIIRKSRDSGEPVEMILNQMGLWEQIPEETKRLTRFFQDNIRSSKRMGKTFSIAAGLLRDHLADQNQMDMFGKPPAPTPSELIEKAINAVEEAEREKQGQLF